MGTSAVEANQGRLFGYVRVSTAKQDGERQRLQLLEWAGKKKRHFEEIVDVSMSAKKSQKDRRIDEIKEKVQPGDTLVVSELSRLGRSIGEIFRLVGEEFLPNGVRVICLKENLDLSPTEENGGLNMLNKVALTLFGLFAEIERDLISERTKDGLAAARKKGKQLGRPKGKSKLDPHSDQIKELMLMEVPLRRIAAEVKCSSVTLGKWLKRTGLKGEVNKELEKRRKRQAVGA